MGLGTRNPRFVARPLELGLGTCNPRFVVWPLELGLGTRNPRFVAWPLELELGTHNSRFVAWPLELGLGTCNPRFAPRPEAIPTVPFSSLACAKSIAQLKNVVGQGTVVCSFPGRQQRLQLACEHMWRRISCWGTDGRARKGWMCPISAFFVGHVGGGDLVAEETRLEKFNTPNSGAIFPITFNDCGGIVFCELPDNVSRKCGGGGAQQKKNTQKEWQKDKEQGPRTPNWGVTTRVSGWAQSVIWMPLAVRRTMWT